MTVLTTVLRYSHIAICAVMTFYLAPSAIASDGNSGNITTSNIDCTFVRIIPEKYTYKINQQIYINIEINLCSNGTYSLFESGDTYDIIVTDSGGNQLQLSSGGRAIYDTSDVGNAQLGIKPGTIVKRKELLNMYYDIKKPGTYTIEIKVSNLMRNQEEIKLKSNKISIKLE